MEARLRQRVEPGGTRGCPDTRLRATVERVRSTVHRHGAEGGGPGEGGEISPDRRGRRTRRRPAPAAWRRRWGRRRWWRRRRRRRWWRRWRRWRRWWRLSLDDRELVDAVENAVVVVVVVVIGDQPVGTHAVLPEVNGEGVPVPVGAGSGGGSVTQVGRVAGPEGRADDVQWQVLTGGVLRAAGLADDLGRGVLLLGCPDRLLPVVQDEDRPQLTLVAGAVLGPDLQHIGVVPERPLGVARGVGGRPVQGVPQVPGLRVRVPVPLPVVPRVHARVRGTVVLDNQVAVVIRERVPEFSTDPVVLRVAELVVLVDGADVPVVAQGG